MRKNVGSADKIVRIVLAVVLGGLVLAKAVTGALAVVLGIVAGIMLLTGGLGWCGLYTVLGINTNKCCGGSADGGDKKGCGCGHKE